MAALSQMPFGSIQDLLAAPYAFSRPPGLICSSSAGCFEEAIPSYAFGGRLTRPQGSVRVDLDGTVAADDAGQFAQSSERRLPAERLQPVCLITVSPEEVPGPHWPEAKKRPLLDLSRSGLIRGRKQTSPVCQRIGTPEKSAIERWPELTHRGSVSK
ncbi:MULTISPECIES: hypothetical protein [unclassified Bradyrhizobium]|uniref:hypothetical protein n=1 Tax=unclassified Bradyrhizobium TaxID=2631580 RepID=UPI001FF84621|nr:MULTISPECIES: hypothetical protein [unclassified Bradyrhizobium]